ncbi:MAG: MATE family efflux transporter [Erysipelotrichaceae bacterium]|nr:MATE family efflux transporter [Erysipelotrichaceae bacterium]
MSFIHTLRKRWFADLPFYRKVLLIAVPIMLQNAVTNFVNLLDNIMIGRVGTLEMSGVSIANQLLFIFNITIFGCVNAAGIFSAQYCGKNDYEGVRNCLRVKIAVAAIAIAAAMTIFLLQHDALIGLYLNDDLNSAADIARTLEGSRSYLLIMLAGLPAFAFSQCISSTMREDGETVAPMKASFLAVGINFVFNYLLIFGKFGFPRLGIQGAAVATVLSRFAELAYLFVLCRMISEEKTYFKDVFAHFAIPRELILKVLSKGTPLVINELLWSLGIAGINQCYSTRGLDAVAACNIYSTVNNLFFIVCIGMGSSIGIIVGQQLGAGKLEEAVQYDRWLIVFALILSSLTGTAMIFSAPFFPLLYNTTETVRTTAAALLRVAGLAMPVGALCNACYFTMRCGGKTIITFISDSVFTCLVSWPLAFVLASFTSIPVVLMVLLVAAADLIKGVFGLVLVEKKVWVHNLVARS